MNAGGVQIGVTPVGQNIPQQAHSPSPKEIQDLADWEAQNFSIDTKLAHKQYIRADAVVADSSGKVRFSVSQDMNYKLDNNIPLPMNERFVHANLQKGMHTQNADIVMYRGAHQDILQALGVKNYHKMTEAQLQKALVGKSFSTTSYWSMSYDKSKNPFLSGSLAGGREVEMTIKQGGKTKIMLGARKQAEVIANIGTNYKITGVNFTGRIATPGGYGSMPVVHLNIETI